MTTRDHLFYPFPINPDDSHIESPKIYVRRLAKDEATCVFRKLVHRHTFFEIVWLLKDNATLFCDFQSHSLHAGTLAFISPGQIHAWDMNPEKSEGIAIFFSLDLFSLYGRGPQFLQELPFYYTSDLPILKVEKDKRAIFDHLFTTAFDRNLLGGEKRDELLLAYLNVALIEALRLYEAGPERSPVDASFQIRATSIFLCPLMSAAEGELILPLLNTNSRDCFPSDVLIRIFALVFRMYLLNDLFVKAEILNI